MVTPNVLAVIVLALLERVVDVVVLSLEEPEMIDTDEADDNEHDDDNETADDELVVVFAIPFD